MDIPARRIPISLLPATPTELTVDSVKKQLTNIGLTCPDADKDKIVGYIKDLKEAVPNGQVKVFTILRPARPGELSLEEFAGSYVQSSVGNYEPDPTGIGYAPELHYIQYPTHFDWLMANKPGFTGTKVEPPTFTGRFDTVTAVKKMFIDAATTTSAALVKGLDKEALESVFSNLLGQITDHNVRDYAPGPQSIVIFLVDGYDAEKQSASSVGVLTVVWDLTIRDYKEKKKIPLHQTSLNIKTRAVLYSSLDVMFADKLAAEAHFKDKMMAGIPVRPPVVKIFDKLPAADAATFRQSLPLTPTQDILKAVVLYAPQLQVVGSIDNSLSDTTTIYTKSVTTGFTFSASQSIGAEAVFEASIIIADAKVGFTLTFSFTEEWSKATTESMQFSVPPGKKAFTYQGFVMAKQLIYDAKANTFTYGAGARVLSNVLVTTTDPINPPNQ